MRRKSGSSFSMRRASCFFMRRASSASERAIAPGAGALRGRWPPVRDLQNKVMWTPGDLNINDT
eukprot:11139366-Heterocapsa_arctica.AAC.1